MDSEEERARKVKAVIDSHKVGQVDTNDFIVTNVLASGNVYVIYEIKTDKIENSIRIYIDDSELERRYGNIRIKFSEVKQHLYKVVDKQSIKSIIAQILVHALLDNEEDAQKKFDELIKRINEEYFEQYRNRLRLIFGAGILFSVFVGIYGGFYFSNSDDSLLKNVVLSATCGSFGGFFSILLSVSKLRCEQGVPQWIYWVYGMVRILISVLAGILIYLAVKIDLVFGFCNDLSSPETGYAVFAILAGFSESLVPNFLKKLENEVS